MRENQRPLAQDAHDILRDYGRAREAYRRTNGKCCLVGALAIAWENLHGEKLLVPERVNGKDVYVFDDDARAATVLRPVMEQVANGLPDAETGGEFLDYDDMLSNVLLFNDHDDTTDAQVLAVLKEVAA